METIYRSYEYRIYPNEEQVILIDKHIGSCRWVYNYALEKKIKIYQQDKVNISRFTIQKDLPLLKKAEATSWLKEVNSQSLQAAIEHLDKAFVKFFREKKGFPRFKAKHRSNQSFSIPQETKVNWEECLISVPKIKNIKFVVDRRPTGTIRSSTISKTPTGKYFISILIDTGSTPPDKPMMQELTTVGIDLGIKHFLITSTGDKIDNPRYLKNNIFKLKKLQRRASKKTKGSNNRRKAFKRVALLHERIRNQRNDFLHKTSTKLIRENQTICLETLSVKNMVRNHCLAQAISDAAWGTFVSMIQYKSEWYGKNVLRIGTFEPSSKMCSCCGHVNKSLTLNDREWTCSECGVTHDRDINAAKNIKVFGLHVQNVGAERPNLKLLENTLLEGSVKEEIYSSLMNE